MSKQTEIQWGEILEEVPIRIEYKLGQLADITSSKRIFYSEYTANGVPYFRSKEIIDIHNRRNNTSELFISEEKYLEIKNKFGVPEPDDILLTTVGTLGIPYLIKQGDRFYFKDGNLTWFRNINKKIIDVQYFLTWIRSPIGQQKLDQIAIGSTQAWITIYGLKDLSIDLPSLPEQRAIASIISSLDDKIDLLHRQNATLEALAETLFRRWFVEEAKEDWEEMSLLDVIQLVGGGTPKTSVVEYWDGDIPWLSGGDIASNHKGFVTSAIKTITELGVAESSVKILPKYATVISARGTVGKYCLLALPMTFSQSNYGILPKFQGCYFFTYLLINHAVAELQSAAYGSVFDTITTTTFQSIAINSPLESEVVEFENKASAYFQKILTNTNQIQTLSTLRDTLLPKLMSGEVRVAY